MLLLESLRFVTYEGIFFTTKGKLFIPSAVGQKTQRRLTGQLGNWVDWVEPTWAEMCFAELAANSRARE